LNKEEIKKIIDKIESFNSKDEAYFGIFDTGPVNQNEGFIKGNREGLSLFAIELLKAIQKKDDSGANEKSVFYSLDQKAEWIDERSVIRIAYIEASDEPRKKAEFQPVLKSGKVKIIEITLILIIIFGILAMIVGIITIAKWMF